MKTAILVLLVISLVALAAIFAAPLALSRRLDDAEQDLHAPPDDLT